MVVVVAAVDVSSLVLFNAVCDMHRRNAAFVTAFDAIIHFYFALLPRAVWFVSGDFLHIIKHLNLIVHAIEA